MAATQLSDIIDVTVFQDLDPVNSPEKTDFFQAGLAVRTDLFDTLANADGKIAELPFWKDLNADDEPNYSTDDTGSSATPKKVTQGEQITRKAFLNQGWSATDLAVELAMGTDAIQHVRNRVGTYWMRQWQRRLVASVLGVQADNAANDGGDMTHDIAVEDTTAQGPGTRWSEQAFIDAAYTMGDMVDGVTAIAVHSMVAKQITEQNGAEDVRDSEGNLLYRSYKGRRIIVDDGLPVVAGTTSGYKYLSVLFGPGAFAYGEGSPTVPVEIDRAPELGDGGGVETLWTRNTWILHPFGFQQTGTPAGVSFTNTELTDETVWDRVVERKNVPMAFLWTN
ncbi:phage coat protein [Oricola thermophila]|uniref:Phage coat protein n=1 Tax=Oricola thermophila TaxID=2742145 RepID=A0A6N1VB12_9HYPH|nr:phage coat protein [Oricola thermophila]QKV17848.1 phage coat protein [Oricola thermophila]